VINKIVIIFFIIPPLENGEVTWSCWMDMIPGKFTVTEDGTSPETQTEISDE